MSLFNNKEKTPNHEDIGEEVEAKKDQEQEFGPILSEAQIRENQNLFKKVVKSSSENQNITIEKESEEEKNAKIKEVLESIRKSNI